MPRLLDTLIPAINLIPTVEKPLYKVTFLITFTDTLRKK